MIFSTYLMYLIFINTIFKEELWFYCYYCYFFFLNRTLNNCEVSKLDETKNNNVQANVKDRRFSFFNLIQLFTPRYYI